MTKQKLLTATGLYKSFGGLKAVNNAQIDVEQGSITGLIGPNGAGKTTIFNLITGIYKPTEGEVLLEGQNLVGMRPHQIASLGLARTFQNLRLWRHMTVLEQHFCNVGANKTGGSGN